jgi:cyclohexyl-isocyanide hydratase
MEMKKLKIVMLLFPDLTILDFVGPYDVFIKTPCFEVYTVSLNGGEIIAEGGLAVKAGYSFQNCPSADILFVPGGIGITSFLTDKVYIDFLQKQGKHAKYITSVCTGALLLAAAGLLTGYRATTHWRSLELLRMLNIDAVDERVVVDRNRITGGGVTAGIDFGLVLAALICGEESANVIQLLLEYNPQPPFNSGSPASAEQSTLVKALEITQPLFERRREIIDRMIL